MGGESERYATIGLSESSTNPQVIERIGGRHRARTGDLLVANEALSHAELAAPIASY